MDDGNKCLLDVIGDSNALESFLGPFEDQGNNPNNGSLGSQRFPELHVNTNATNNIDHDDILSELFSPTDMLSPTLLPTNGIQDSLQSAAALAGITDEDAFDDQPSVEPTLPTNTNNNQASNAVPQPNLPSSQPIQQNVSIPQPVFITKPNQAQPTTSFITSTPAAALPAPVQASASAPVQIQAPAPIQTLQPVGNVAPQINPQPIQQQQSSTITLPVPQTSTGSGIQLSLTPQQLATLQQGGGRIIQSGKTVQIVPNPPPQPQLQIVQAIQPNGMPIRLALIPSNPFAGQHVIIRQPLKAGAKVGNQLVRSPSRNPPNIQPKLTTAGQVTKPVNIRPLQVLAPQQITSGASTVAQPSIVLQPPAATAAVAGGPAAQTLQLANLTQQQQVAVSVGQNVLLHNQVAGVPVVTMGVSRGSIIVMSRPSATMSQQQQLTTTTVNSSTTKPSLAPAPSTTPEIIKPKPAPKKKKSKKKKKDEKSKPPTSSAAAPTSTAASVSVTQSVTTLTTSTAGQQTMLAVTYAQQTFVTNNGQTIVMQPPMNPATSGAVPIVQQVNLAALPQGALSQLQQQQQGTSGQQQQVRQQFHQVTMTSSTGQQIIANIPKPPNSTQMTSEQHQQYLIQQIKLQQQKKQQQQALLAQTPQQILPAVTSSAATNVNSIQQTNSRQTPSPRPPAASGVVPQIQLGQTVAQSGQMLQTAQNQLQTIQNQQQSAQNQLQATQNQVQLGQQQTVQQSQLSPVPKQQLSQQQPGQNQIQPVVFPTSQASLQPQSISGILKSGQQQQQVQQNQQQVAAGSQQQSIQNQVQLVSSSQVSGLKVQQQQQLVSQPQQQIALSNQQQPQLISQPQQPQLISQPQQPQLISQPQQPQLVSRPQQQQTLSQISMSGSGGIHIIPTGQTQGQKEIRTVAELQQFLQQNPQAMKQVLELKRQHMLRQQQQLQMQKQQQQLQQQQQQSGLQTAQPAQANSQQVGQSSQQQQSVTMVTQQQQQQVQPQQPPQIQLTKPPPLPVPQNLGSSESQPTSFQQLMSPPQQATQQQQSHQPQQLQQVQLLQNQQSLQQQQNQQLPALQSNQQTQQQQSQSQQQSSTQQLQLQQQQSSQSSQQAPLQTQQVQQQQQQLQPLTVTTQYNPHKQKTSPAQKILSPYEKQFAAFLQQRTGKSDDAQTSSSGTAAQPGQPKVHELPKPVGNMNPPSSSSTMLNSVSSSFSGSAGPSSSASSQLSLSFSGSATPVPLQPMSIQAPQQQQQHGQLQQGSGQPQQQQPSITVLQGKIPISPQTQQQLMMIQSKINKLNSIEQPNDQEKEMLLKYQQLQRRIVEGIRAQLISWNNTAHRYPTQPGTIPTSQSVSGPAGGMILQQASTPVKSGSNQPVTAHIQTSASTSQASTSGAAQQQVSPPKSIKPGLKIVSGPNMTPQQKAMVNKLQEQLKKLTPEQAKQLISSSSSKQQQQLLKISQGKQGGKLIIQPANPQAVVLQSIIGAGKIIIQGNKKDSEKKKKPQGPSKAQLQRSSRVAQRLLKDKVEVQKTDTKTPFKNVWDAVTRLLPFHLCRDETMTDKELDKAEEEFEGECTGLLQKKQEMLNKYQMLLFQESMRIDPSAEMVMIDRMFMHEEKLSLQADRKEATEHPEIYDQMVANQPEATANSSTELDTTANTTASIKTDEDGEEAESIVQSPTASTKKFNQSDLFSPNSSPTQAASEANMSFSPNDSKVSSPQSTSSNWLNNHSSKRGTSLSSQDNKSLDESSETEDTMDGSFENATVTKISATNLKVTFRKQKKSTKKRSGGLKKSKSSSVSNSVQNHVKHKHDHEDDPATDHLDQTESNSKVAEEDASVNGSTNGTNERVESKPHQRSDSCIPFRKRKFKQITDNLSPVKGGSVAIDRTSSSSSNTPTPVGFKEKVSRVDDGTKSVFRFDSIGEEERTNDSVFTKEPEDGSKRHSAKKSDTIKRSDFEFEEVSEPEDGPDMLKEQMESAINSIINLRHHSLSSEPKTPLKSLSLDLPTPTFDMPPIGSLADSARLESDSASNSIQFESSQDAKASLGIEGASSFSAALGCGDDSSAMKGLSYDGSNFGMDDSNDIKAVTSQEFFGTGTGLYLNSNDLEEETSIVDDLQKELNLLSQSYEMEEDSDDGESRAADPDLEEAVNSILF